MTNSGLFFAELKTVWCHFHHVLTFVCDCDSFCYYVLCKSFPMCPKHTKYVVYGWKYSGSAALCQGMVCFFCGLWVVGFLFELEAVIKLSKSDPNHPKNLVICSLFYFWDFLKIWSKYVNILSLLLTDRKNQSSQYMTSALVQVIQWLKM